MKAQSKMQYTTPVLQIVELHAKASLCGGSNRSIDWTYDNDIFSPDSGDGWGRPGYGDAIDF